MPFSLLYAYDVDRDAFLADADKLSAMKDLLRKEELLGSNIDRSMDLYARKHMAEYRDYLRNTHNFDGHSYRKKFELIVPYDKQRNVKGFKEDFELVEIAEDAAHNFQITFHFKTPRNVEDTAREMRFIRDALSQQYENPIIAPKLLGNIRRFSREHYYSSQLYVMQDKGALHG